MIKSMTGFGRGEHGGKLKHVVVEIKSVNHRYNEVLVKMPRQYNLLEDAVRRYILSRVSRGRIEVFMKVDEAVTKPRDVQVDKELALAYYKALKELAGITETFLDVGVIQLAQLPNVLKVEEEEEDLEIIWQDMLPALSQAADALMSMREKEGEKLHLDLLERLKDIKALHGKLCEKSPKVVILYREKLQSRLKELLDDVKIDENRLTMEVALFADRSSINEELVRMESHLSQFAGILQENNPVGRKLDFLLQELNREINTIGSKANDLEITQYVVEVKSELEKMREQVQNIE
ncbi:YicC family protein [Thermanaerosceptrum fracticalcis]|uniref:YicC family protein n=1 Tax=Thermanaerosceptrum fracticalcis TaxID=1712410 RepID=A0A7G6E1P7_THEFR|nr:YicC/YloC family endoribonuclease [Thermanaerosceptrum fracticalcis]QNB46001.1 YicC family protein [Thermanaerosceptrum fracticalcis]